jgi:hypothetical protein
MAEDGGTFSTQQIEAAEEFAETAIELLGTENGFHPPTLVAATARMAGTFLFRSFAFKLEGASPGQAVLSETANEHGPRLIQIAWGVLAHLGVSLDEDGASKSLDPEDQPSKDFLATQKELEPAFLDIKDLHGLSQQEAADAAAIASAILIHQNLNSLDPNVGFGIAVYGFIEGTKTVPDPVTL